MDGHLVPSMRPGTGLACGPPRAGVTPFVTPDVIAHPWRPGCSDAANADIDQAATAIARGYAPAQIESLAKAAPADRPLAVALEVLVKLADQGVAQDQAIARVQAKLEAKEADDAINERRFRRRPKERKKP